LSDVATALVVQYPNLNGFVRAQRLQAEQLSVHSRRTGSSALGLHWDMATCGDPLIDVGTLLNYWPDPSDTPEDRPLILEGMATLGLPRGRRFLTAYRRQPASTSAASAGTKRSLASRPPSCSGSWPDDMRSANRQTPGCSNVAAGRTDGSSGRAPAYLRRRKPRQVSMSLPDTASPVEGQIELMTGLAPTASKETPTTARPLEGVRVVEAASYITVRSPRKLSPTSGRGPQDRAADR